MAADAPDTVSEAVAELQAAGYTNEFGQRGGDLVCPVCGSAHPLDGGLVDSFYRFEGPSDPADEAIVLAVRCPNCGAKGTVVSAYGADADPDAFAHLAKISAEVAERPIKPRQHGLD